FKEAIEPLATAGQLTKEAASLAIERIASDHGLSAQDTKDLKLVVGVTTAVIIGAVGAKGGLATKGLPIPENLGRTIHSGAQDKHIPGTNNYDPSRSTLTADPQSLLDGVHSGQYTIVREIPRGNTTSYIVDFGSPIGEFKSNGTLVGPTQYGQIVQGKNGVHIIPANPIQY
ncbi:polymorphic toxin type 50 domain-containing protein, partial [Ciceribacter sp. RN22]|uniref:polymorphic toxin type 50 domain-containing protein n=1 Tax=Ciceribacter sp. RN22 TaxID=2954932 RepID=UPI002092D4FD